MKHKKSTAQAVDFLCFVKTAIESDNLDKITRYHPHRFLWVLVLYLLKINKKLNNTNQMLQKINNSGIIIVVGYLRYPKHGYIKKC